MFLFVDCGGGKRGLGTVGRRLNPQRVDGLGRATAVNSPPPNTGTSVLSRTDWRAGGVDLNLLTPNTKTNLTKQTSPKYRYIRTLVLRNFSGEVYFYLGHS